MTGPRSDLAYHLQLLRDGGSLQEVSPDGHGRPTEPVRTDQL
jgi:hypothetical protein